MLDVIYSYAFWIYILFISVYILTFLFTRKKYMENKGSVLFRFSLFAICLLVSSLAHIFSLVYLEPLPVLDYLGNIIASIGLAFFVSIQFSIRFKFLKIISYSIPFFVSIHFLGELALSGIIPGVPTALVAFLGTFSIFGYSSVILLAIYASLSATFKIHTNTKFLEGILFSIVSFSFLMAFYVYIGFINSQLVLSGFFFYGFITAALGVHYYPAYDIEDLR